MTEAQYRDEDTLKRLHHDQGLTTYDIADRFEMSQGTITYWMEKHGIERNGTSPDRITDAELIDALHRLDEKVEGTPTYWENKELGEYSSFVYQKRFGSWNNALREADLELNHAPLVEVTCANCGDTKETSRHYVERNENHYCDRECRSEYYKTKTECDHCGTIFPASRWYVENGWRDFCTKQCFKDDVSNRMSGESNYFWVELVTLTCDYCGADLEKYPSLVRDQNFCDTDCFAEWRSENVVGEAHPNWAGGKPGYYGPNWASQRQATLDRDSFECQDCGLTRDGHKRDFGEDLHVHHRVPITEFKENGVLDYEAANRLTNLLTLCRDCHEKWEDVPVQPIPDAQ